jgi:hypothetical protein
MPKFDEFSPINSMIIVYDGMELRTIADPIVSDSGKEYIATAVDAENNQYEIRWNVINFDTTDESEAADWNAPASVELAKVTPPLEYVGATWIARLWGTTQQNVSKSGLAALKPNYRGTMIRPDAICDGKLLWLKSRFEGDVDEKDHTI